MAGPGRAVGEGRMVRLGLLGDPIAHSLSPALHRRFLQQAGLKGEYVLRPCQQLAGFDDLDGFNLTTPLKQQYERLPDVVVDPAVERCGAANTIVRRKDRWHAYNTDGAGFVLAMAHRGWPSQLDVLIVGSGGAARGVGSALTERGCKVMFVGRNAHAVRDAAGCCAPDLWSTLDDVECLGRLFAASKRPRLVIWAVPASAKEQVYKQLAPFVASQAQGGVQYWSDMNYFDADAGSIAQSLGVPFMGGLPMLVAQGALAFELFTGFAPTWRPLLDAAEANCLERDVFW